MRGLLLATGLGISALWIAGGSRSFAQQQTLPASGAQQKDSAKTHASPDSSSSGSSGSGSSGSGSSGGHSTAADNPFPEAVSQAAAQKASQDKPEDQSSAQPDTKSPHSAAKDNPFPEDVSRKAAQAATGDSSSKNPPGFSSSQSSSLTGDLSGKGGNSPAVTDPTRAKKDTQVGAFYLNQGDSQGAYLRYQDAMKYDPTNIDAIFGAAEAARRLGKLPEAAHNYQLYLEISPNGPKAKRALKALDTLPGEK